MLGRIVADDRGNMAMLFALAFSLSTLISAIVVDASALYHERRMLQTGVDLAAIAAAGDPTRGRERAEVALVHAGLADALASGALEVVVGHYAANPNVAPEARFSANATPLNAAMVRLTHPGTLYFGTGIRAPPTVSARGLARVTPEVSFTLGSRLASLEGGVANQVLSRLLGTSISLSALDYQRLATVKVNAFDFLDALAIRMGVEAGSYDDLLHAGAGAGQIAAALSDLVNGTEKGALNAIALAGPGRHVPLEKLLDLGRFGRLGLHDTTATLAANLSVLEILSAAAALGDGTRQVHVPIALSVPGLVKFAAELAIGEPPQGGGWFAVGPAGTVVRTAQLRLRIALTLGAGTISSGGLLNLPIWLDVAPAQARIMSATCPNPDDPRGTASVAVLPGVLTLSVGTLSEAQLVSFGALPPLAPVKLLDAGLISVTGASRVTIAQTAPIMLQFSSADIAAGAVKTARTQTMVSSLLGSLLSHLDLKISIDILAIGLNVDAIAKAVGALLAPLAAPLDALLHTILQVSGLGIGEADVRVHAVACTDAALVG